MIDALKIENLTVNYGKTPALWEISFAIPSGHLVGIIGPNGAGKSTLIKAALGIVKPLAGAVHFFGQPLKKVRQKVAYVPQRESVDWDFPITVRELVMMGRYGRLGLFRRPGKEDHQAVDRCLEAVDMLSLSHRQISQLSGGQQQRVFFARALIQEADLYFMDEPFAGIDLASQTLLMRLLTELKSEGKTIFVVHHDLHRVEEFFDWVILLNMRLVTAGPLEHSFTQEAVSATYGTHSALFDETLKLSQKISGGS